MKVSTGVLPDHILWPNNLENKIYSGFSNKQLKIICDWKLNGYDLNLPKKSSSWIYWTVELYSFGRCYREWLGLPYWMPLPLYGDHSISNESFFSPHEVNSKPKHYITFSKFRFKSLKKEKKKILLQLPCPWIMFRHKHKLKKKKNAIGTIIFFSHTCDGIEIKDYNFDKYFRELKAMPSKYHPLVICMHMNDINKGYHLKIRKYGIPIISAGETSSPYFVERFYSMISRFNFATSSRGGSELYYCEEFGIPYFIKGEEPGYINFGNKNKPLGIEKSVAINKQIKLFSNFPPRRSQYQRQFISDTIGISVNKEKAKKFFYRYLIKEYLRHISEVFFSLIKYFIVSFLTYKILLLIKRINRGLKRGS
jgi:hypothetical protein